MDGEGIAREASGDTKIEVVEWNGNAGCDVMLGYTAPTTARGCGTRQECDIL